MTSDDVDLDHLDEVIAPLRVRPGAQVRLPDDFDAGMRPSGLRKKRGAKVLKHGTRLLGEFQDRLAAQGTSGVLVVLQALDAAGKDGTIRHVMTGVNPQGVEVRGFKVPTPQELAHDYLWRYARELPRRGMITIFNRSYYEEVLVVRVHPELLARQHLPAGPAGGPDPWQRRFNAINDFERHLTDNGFRVVKLFLNISREEQRRRFLRRIDLPGKNWKFSAHDLAERERWDDYQRAFADMLTHTSTAHAPWFVVPADHKWVERLAVSAVLLRTLRDIDPQYPRLADDAQRRLLDAKVGLEREAPDGAALDPFAAAAD